ncbi:MAG TPA: glutamate mutase L, partial [Anaerolineaceae bacterium]|nr:glutamate mutase L [Anaerolineaceae bacterium]
QLDAIVRSGPDLILVAGGTDGGASRSVAKQIELINLVCRILPTDRRPEILYVGNQILAARIKEALDKFARTTTAPNIRPSIDIEDINPAMGALTQVLTHLRTRKIGGLESYLSMVSTPALPATAALGHIVRFLSGIYDPKPVLAIDVGASWTTLVTAQHGALSTNVSPFGVGGGITGLLQHSKVEEIAQWLPIQIPLDVVRDYLWQKALYPASIPVSIEALAIEQSLARQVIRAALQATLTRWPNLNIAFEPILASGAILTQASTPAQALLILLDSLQPAGITLVALDQNGVLPALGAVSTFNSILPVQVIESGALLNLATVIAPISNEKFGTPILSVHMEYENGSTSNHQIAQGSLTALPLSPGQKARVYLKPLRRLDLNPYGGQRLTNFNATGGVCGLVIDCRGRPLQLPQEEPRRRDLIRKWLTALGNLPPAQ